MVVSGQLDQGPVPDRPQQGTSPPPQLQLLPPWVLHSSLTSPLLLLLVLLLLWPHQVPHIKYLETKRGTRLMVSSWWGWARKINYTGDWLMGLAWCLLTGFSHLLPYFYAIYFAGLLVHRAARDDHACAIKVGEGGPSDSQPSHACSNGSGQGPPLVSATNQP